jgi:hypothetical protein
VKNSWKSFEMLCLSVKKSIGRPPVRYNDNLYKPYIRRPSVSYNGSLFKLSIWRPPVSYNGYLFKESIFGYLWLTMVLFSKATCEVQCGSSRNPFVGYLWVAKIICWKNQALSNKHTDITSLTARMLANNANIINLRNHLSLLRRWRGKL